MTDAEANEIIREASRRHLLNFSISVMPSMEIAPFHRVYYDVLTRFAYGDIRRLIISMPPQHGKSQGATRFLPAFIAGRSPEKKIAVSSYNYTSAGDFNTDIQRIMSSPEYADIFPAVQLPDGRTGQGKRNSEVLDIVGGGSLRFVGRGGTLTGKTVDVSIIDDLYKDYAEANSPIIRESAWKWYITVLRTRLHNDSQELIVFTRWHEEDIIGHLMESEIVRKVTSREELDNIDPSTWIYLNFEAIKTGEPTDLDPREDGEPLWESKHSLSKLLAQRELDPVQFNCLYQGNPGGAEGRLYGAFKTYTDKSEWGRLVRRGNYTDVADKGNDYLVSVCYDICDAGRKLWNEQKQRYEPLLFALVTDIVMTQEDTEITTNTVPDMLNRNDTQRAWIESNNGGSQFERTIARRTKCQTVAFTQKDNKESRILTTSAGVCGQIVMPLGWESRFPAFHKQVTEFLRDFRANTHDDAPDVLAGIYEKELAGGNNRPYQHRNRGVTVSS